MKNRIYTLNEYYRETFGEKVYRLSLDGGFTCPNRDGTVGRGGCIFCSGGGSGEFAADRRLPIREQLDQAKTLFSCKQTGNKYIAYFQAFTGTYAPVPRLHRLYREAMAPDWVVGLCVATRPDCLPDDVISLLSGLNKEKPVYVELGLQTIHEKTARFIRRGYRLPVFEQAMHRLKEAGLFVTCHIILGLPGESTGDLWETIAYLNRMPIDGIKLSMLHILRGTDLAQIYEHFPFPLYEKEEYTELVIDCLERLRPDIVVHRMTGDGPKQLLLAPLWSLDKRGVLNGIHKRMKERDAWQGRKEL